MKYSLRLLFLACLLWMGGSAIAQLTSTNLPIIVVNTNSTPIGDTQILASFKIVNNSSGVNMPNDPAAYMGNIGIDFRGSSLNPKKSYNIETWTSFKTEIDTPLLGMPSENDWVLLASYTDRSFVRNIVGHKLFEAMGNYAPRMKLCEVMINGSYEGVYLFGENIKRDENRVDIANLRNIDNSGAELTGGYIFKIDDSNDDYWVSSYPPPLATGSQEIRFHFDEPEDNDITSVQKAYIKGYVNDFETALQGTDYQDTTNGWRKYAGHKSFKEYFILNEVMKSADAYRKSTYLHKDKSKKLRVGPTWDLEPSLYNTMDGNASRDTGWAFQYNTFFGNSDRLVPFWWSRLYTDTLFNREMRCRYQEMRATILSSANINFIIDSVSTYVNAQQALDRNFTKWPIWGTPLINEPTPLSANHAEEVTKIKDFINRRLQWLDAQWLPVVCLTSDVPTVATNVEEFDIYPNPVANIMYAGITLKEKAVVELKMYDVLGRTVASQKVTLTAGMHTLQQSTNALPKGTYMVQLFVDGAPGGVRRILK